MDRKLTLTIEQNLIVKAKEFARQKGVSLSAIVENYFILLTGSSVSTGIELSSTVKSLKGSFKAPQDFNYQT